MLMMLVSFYTNNGNVTNETDGAKSDEHDTRTAKTGLTPQ